ncbi:MAG: hypothetical protein ABIU20_07505 [Blastocatellia bacterium]
MKRILISSAILAIALTLFYFIHEDLPKFLRAPTSLILAPIAIVDGVCYALGISGIYGKWIPVFFVNWVAAAIFCYLLLAVKKRWGSKPNPPISN